MLAKPTQKSRSPWKWIAIVFICLFLISTAVAIAFAVEASAFRKLFRSTQSFSISQSREIKDLNETIESYERALGISPDPLLDEVDPEFAFTEMQGDVLDSNDFTLKIPTDIRSNLIRTEAYGTMAYLWNYEENTAMLEAPPSESYQIIFSYSDSTPSFFETDFLSVTQTMFLGKNVTMGDGSWFGYLHVRSYYFEDTGLSITIQPTDKAGRDAAVQLLQDLEWK